MWLPLMYFWSSFHSLIKFHIFYLLLGLEVGDFEIPKSTSQVFEVVLRRFGWFDLSSFGAVYFENNLKLFGFTILPDQVFICGAGRHKQRIHFFFQSSIQQNSSKLVKKFKLFFSF
jgi:hypothetical protein